MIITTSEIVTLIATGAFLVWGCAFVTYGAPRFYTGLVNFVIVKKPKPEVPEPKTPWWIYAIGYVFILLLNFYPRVAGLMLIIGGLTGMGFLSYRLYLELKKMYWQWRKTLALAQVGESILKIIETLPSDDKAAMKELLKKTTNNRKKKS